VSWIVFDSSTGDPLAKVTVHIGYQCDVTERDGKFFIKSPPVGNHTITANKYGYRLYSETVGYGATYS